MPVVVFFHCEEGVDRTGEVAAGYAMKYLNQTFQEVMTFNDHVISRNIEKASFQAAQWYCWYLYYAQGQQSLDCSGRD